MEAFNSSAEEKCSLSQRKQSQSMKLGRVRLATGHALPFVGLGGPAPVPPRLRAASSITELSSGNPRLAPAVHVAALGRSPELAASPTRASLICWAAQGNGAGWGRGRAA